MKQSRGEKIFGVFNYIFLGLLAVLSLYPFWEVIRISISTPAEASRMAFSLWPRKQQCKLINMCLKTNIYGWDIKILFRILIGMSIQMTLMILVAYPLSKKKFPNRNFWTMVIVFTMFFRGGMIPNYILIKSLGMDDTIWALVLPRAIDTFAMFILRNYFMSLPESLEESAKIDGASSIRILACIILPLSMPILMTVGLWGTVWHWNSWFDCLIYIRDYDKYVLQAILRKIIIDAAPQFNEMASAEGNTVQISAEVVKCATIIVSSLPIMLAYPFIQKYFVKGVMVGSLKG